MSAAWALLSGTLFGAGLAVSGMTNPAKVLAFLDVTGAWDPSLALVMGAALAVSAASYAWARAAEPFDAPFAELFPSNTAIDARLIAGAVLFGLGWGLAGFCPGPALAAIITGSARVFLFVGSMLVGVLLYRWTPIGR